METKTNTIQNAVELTVEWYYNFLSKKNLYEITSKQIKNYLNLR